MADFMDPIVQIFLLLFIICFMIILSQRKYFALVLMKLRNRDTGHCVKIWHKDRSFTEYIVPNVRSFNWRKKFYAKMFDTLPEWLDQVQIPDTPYARDRRTKFPLYEFNEDSKICIDPYSRQPDLSMYEADQNDLENSFEMGRKWERQNGGSNFNKLIFALLILNLLATGFGLTMISGIQENLTKFGEKVAPLIERADQLVKDIDSGKIKLPGSIQPVAGQVGQVT